MIPFKSKIIWVGPSGSVEIYSPNRFYARCLQAYQFFKNLTPKKIVVFWEHTPDALAVFIGGLMANKIMCYYSVPNFKLDKAHFDLQLSQLKKRSLATVGSPTFKYLNLNYIFDFNVPDKVINFREDYTLDFTQFSSGSTGIRKQISYRGKDLIFYADEFSRVFGLEENSTVAGWGPHYHDLGLIWGILIPLIKGHDILYTSNLDWITNPGAILDSCIEHEATALLQPNFAFSFMNERCDKKDLSFMKFYNCGEVISKVDCEKFEEKFNTPVFASWGLAEALMIVTHSADNTSADGKLRNSGKCFGNNQIRIENGEILLKSDYLFKGYDTGENAKIVDGWFYSGDVGYIKDDLLYVIGREKDSFKVRGQKIVPEVIEMTLNQVKGIKKGRIVCFPMENKKGNTEAVVLFEGDVHQKDLINISYNLGISQCVKVPPKWLVKTSSGKISRKFCREKYIKEKRT